MLIQSTFIKSCICTFPNKSEYLSSAHDISFYSFSTGASNDGARNKIKDVHLVSVSVCKGGFAVVACKARSCLIKVAPTCCWQMKKEDSNAVVNGGQQSTANAL